MFIISHVYNYYKYIYLRYTTIYPIKTQVFLNIIILLIVYFCHHHFFGIGHTDNFERFK